MTKFDRPSQTAIDEAQRSHSAELKHQQQRSAEREAELLARTGMLEASMVEERAAQPLRTVQPLMGEGRAAQGARGIASRARACATGALP